MLSDPAADAALQQFIESAERRVHITLDGKHLSLHAADGPWPSDDPLVQLIAELAEDDPECAVDLTKVKAININVVTK
jgi:hypothetical protein